jgi:hypothetical protein
VSLVCGGHQALLEVTTHLLQVLLPHAGLFEALGKPAGAATMPASVGKLEERLPSWRPPTAKLLPCVNLAAYQSNSNCQRATCMPARTRMHEAARNLAAAVALPAGVGKLGEWLPKLAPFPCNTVGVHA